MTDATLYFAYGSNLNAADWARWCAARPRSADPAGMRPVGPAVLPDHVLAFSRDSVARKGGVLDIRPRPGHAVEGVLMEVTPAGWELLDIKEGVGFAYERISIRVAGHDGAWRDVTTYRVLPSEAKPHVPPHEHYVSVCSEGLRDHGLDDTRLRAAAAGRPPRSPAAGIHLPEALHDEMTRVLSAEEREALRPARANGGDDGLFLASDALEDLVERLDPLAGTGGTRFARHLTHVTPEAGAAVRAWTYAIPQIT